ncbi:MAG: gliding motility-associated C-terminal domain-containing protein [Saprospiraceae bacterium]|nr:gliding motility-associated C-terminal domain-containing protein [Saprospiraceae bacterium]
MVANRLILFFLVVLPFSLWATHNRAGEITVEQIGNCSELTLRVTVTTYTKASSVAADRDSVEVSWGDGTKQWLYRTNGPNGPGGIPFGEVLANDIKKNLYVGIHVYPARATYRISMNDPNRIDDILNVNYPNSVSIPFYIETIYTFLNPQFQGCNSTPVLLQPPIDFGCVGRTFVHNPNASDPDKDSLSYHLIVPLQKQGTVVPKYQYPNQIGSGGPNTLTLNPVTGELRWETPLVAGEYNIAMIIVEYRNGVALDTIIRDMQVLVKDCNNNPPVIQTLEEICVIAGDTLDLDVLATDIDAGQLVLLSALGGPFIDPFSPAQFFAPPTPVTPPVSGTFFWPTVCEQISKQPYSVVFKAVDNDMTSPLADLHTLLIKVVGPPPLDVKASPGKDTVSVTWESPYKCQDAANEFFRGFSVWRKIGSNPFAIDTCTPGLSGKGYTRIAFKQKTLVNGRYAYVDTDVEAGRTYCYRIVADFARLSSAGNPFNQVESLPSQEVCVQLSRNLPLLTTVSVESTDLATGEMEIVWSKPRIPDLDTLLYPGPYRYRLLRSPGIGKTNWTPVPGGDFSAPTYSTANDTAVRFDTPLDTRTSPYTYQIEFYTGPVVELLGASAAASSIFLTVASTDQRNVLTWEEEVPWINYQYQVERLNTVSAIWEPLAVTTTPEYMDLGLINGEEYCYRIRSFGDYGIDNLPDTLINLSQEACGIPLDTVPPCPPFLSVSNVCDSIFEGPFPDILENELTWISPLSICPGLSDVAGYQIYFRPPGADQSTLIDELFSAEDTTEIHQPDIGLAGCYFVVAYDSLGNVSAPSNIVCVDNCPDYQLPNTFTPNGDNQNDLFKPYPYRFIEQIDLKIFNRWGSLVYETTDPDILWDGRDQSGKDCVDGTYFYVCKVFEQRVQGIVPAQNLLEGYIQILRP